MVRVIFLDEKKSKYGSVNLTVSEGDKQSTSDRRTNVGADVPVGPAFGGVDTEVHLYKL